MTPRPLSVHSGTSKAAAGAPRVRAVGCGLLQLFVSSFYSSILWALPSAAVPILSPKNGVLALSRLQVIKIFLAAHFSLAFPSKFGNPDDAFLNVDYSIVKAFKISNFFSLMKEMYQVICIFFA